MRSLGTTTKESMIPASIKRSPGGMMPQEPLDTTTRTFATVRLRAGYDRAQVDSFLAEANSEIQRLAHENSSLLGRLESARLESASKPSQHGTGAVAAEAIDEPSAILARAERQHTEFMDFAHTERERLIREAREKAQGMIDDAERLREDTIKSLEQQKMRLEETSMQLHQFEREHRTSMKVLMQEELDELADVAD